MDPLSLAIMGGGTVLGLLGGKKKETKVDPYSQDVASLLSMAKSKMSGPGKRSGIDFNIKPSNISTATENSVLGKIQSPKDYSGYSKTLSADLYKARKAQIDEQYAEENKRQKDMYNRLGLVSSTPYLQAADDLGRKQTTEINAIGAQQAYDDYNREMEAMQFGDTLGLNYDQLGNVLGQVDFSNQKYTQGMEYEDFARAENEPLQWAQLMNGVLGGRQPYFAQETPSTASQFGMGAQDLGAMMMLYSILGKKTGK